MRELLSLTLIIAATTRVATAANAQETHWYRCNTHAHTASFPNSDANASAEFAARWYQTHGYQCLVISDHEHLTPVDELNAELGAKADFLVIRGEEITQGIRDASAPNDVRWSHVNAINPNKAILPIGYPNIPADVSLAETYRRNIAEVSLAGGLPQINHPSGLVGPRLEDLLPIMQPVLFEVWNGFPSVGPLGGADEKGIVTPSFEALWDSLLSRGKTVWGVATDDVHDYFNFDDRYAPTPGKAWIVVQAPSLTLDAVMDGLRRGRFYASTGVSLKEYRVDGAGISITIDSPPAWKSRAIQAIRCNTRFIGRDGKVLAEMPGLSPHYRFTGREEYVRASIIDSDGRRAWTQPVFRDRRAEAP